MLTLLWSDESVLVRGRAADAPSSDEVFWMWRRGGQGAAQLLRISFLVRGRSSYLYIYLGPKYLLKRIFLKK